MFSENDNFREVVFSFFLLMKYGTMCPSLKVFEKYHTNLLPFRSLFGINLRVMVSGNLSVDGSNILFLLFFRETACLSTFSVYIHANFYIYIRLHVLCNII